MYADSWDEERLGSRLLCSDCFVEGRLLHLKTIQGAICTLCCVGDLVSLERPALINDIYIYIQWLFGTFSTKCSIESVNWGCQSPSCHNWSVCCLMFAVHFTMFWAVCYLLLITVLELFARWWHTCQSLLVKCKAPPAWQLVDVCKRTNSLWVEPWITDGERISVKPCEQNCFKHGVNSR